MHEHSLGGARRRAGAAAALLVALASPAAAQDDGRADVAPLRSHTAITGRRTLHGLPLKRVITSAEGWRRVTDGLLDAPPAPDFAAGEACALVVSDTSGGAETWVEALRGRAVEGGVADLVVVLARQEPERPPASPTPKLECSFLVFEGLQGGLTLEHRTLLGAGAGFIQRSFPAVDSDRDPALLPELGPDLRLSVAMFDGSPPPPLEAVKLRLEAYYPRTDRPAEAHTRDFAGGLSFPRIRDDVKAIYGAFAQGLRSRNPLVLRALPPPGPDGSPRPITWTFLLEPLPREGR